MEWVDNGVGLVAAVERDMEPVRILKALANARRLTIIHLLRRRDMSVGEIAGALRLSLRSTSKHLITLSRAELLAYRQEREFVVYRIAYPIHPILACVLDHSCEWVHENGKLEACQSGMRARRSSPSW